MTPEEKVLSVLADHGSLSGLEIMSLTDVPDADVQSIVAKLAGQKMVRLSGSNGRFEDRAITIQSPGLTVASRLAEDAPGQELLQG
jgi:hypothetical protein